jgi:hypothetical protein
MDARMTVHFCVNCMSQMKVDGWAETFERERMGVARDAPAERLAYVLRLRS